jgi:hypothetical protein
MPALPNPPCALSKEAEFELRQTRLEQSIEGDRPLSFICKIRTKLAGKQVKEIELVLLSPRMLDDFLRQLVGAVTSKTEGRGGLT